MLSTAHALKFHGVKDGSMEILIYSRKFPLKVNASMNEKMEPHQFSLGLQGDKEEDVGA